MKWVLQMWKALTLVKVNILKHKNGAFPTEFKRDRLPRKQDYENNENRGNKSI